MVFHVRPASARMWDRTFPKAGRAGIRYDIQADSTSIFIVIQIVDSFLHYLLRQFRLFVMKEMETLY